MYPPLPHTPPNLVGALFPMIHLSSPMDGLISVKASPSRLAVTSPPSGGKMSKISKSCDHCKLKKIKCDQNKPSCDNCLRYREQCVYSVMKKPGLKSGYGQQVFEKIQELDLLLEQNKSQRNTEADSLREKLRVLEDKFSVLERRYSAPGGSGPGALGPTGLGPTVLGPTGLGPTGLGTGSLGAGPGPGSTPLAFHDLSPMHPPPPLAASILTAPTAAPTATSTTAPTTAPVPSPQIPQNLPQIIDIYFECIHPLFPILHPVAESKILRTLDANNPVFLAVLATTIRYGVPGIAPELAENYFAAYKSHIIAQCFAVKSISDLKAIALLAFACYSHSNDHEAWSLISLAAGGCLHLGLNKDADDATQYGASPRDTDLDHNHLDLDHDDPLRPTSVPDDYDLWAHSEGLRCLVWEIYILDKLSSIGGYFPSKLPKKEVKCLLPVNIEFWQFKHLFNKEMIESGQRRRLNDTIIRKPGDYNLYGSNCYIIEALDLMGEIQKFAKYPIVIKDMKSVLSWQLSCYEVESNINLWKESLPESTVRFLDSDSITSANFAVKDIILHCLYHTMIIRLHSTGAFPYFQDKYLVSSQSSRSKCLKLSNLILEISKTLPGIFRLDAETTYQRLGPYYAFAVWVSGRVILVNCLHSEGQLGEDFDYCITLLRQIGSKWPCAMKFADILEFFKDDTLTVDSVSNDGGGIEDDYGSNSDFQSSYNEDTKLISDMRLNASSLDSLLSKKVARYKNAKGSIDDLSIFDWFKLPQMTEGIID